jgi:hypothetical protein
MQRLFLVGVVVLAGCTGVVGPRCRPPVPPGAIANPTLTPDEQRQREREFLALPSGSPAVGPPTYADNPNNPR